MNRYLLIVIPILIAVSCLAKAGTRTVSANGGSDGGGGDTVQPWADSAWFVDRSKSVTACFEKSKSFGLSDSELVTDIKAAYKVWDDYLNLKTGDVNHTQTIDIPTTVRVSSSCSGKEDLTFYFGVTNPAVNTALKEFVDPISFAHRNSHNTYVWDSGFIWIADPANARRLIGADWTISDLLVGFLVHEIGHVLGNGHVAGTIMRADIMNFMKSSLNNTVPTRHAMATNVDWTDDLIEMGFNFNFPGAFAYGYASPCQSDTFCTQYFNELMGRDPEGDISSNLWRQSDDFHLVITDNLGSKDFVLELGNRSTVVVRQKTIFKIYNPNDPAYSQPQDAFPDVIIYFGKITTANGQKADFMFQRGGGMGASWEVDYYGLKTGQIPLFSRLPGGLPFNAP